MTTDFKSDKNLHLAMLCIGLVQISLYYLLGATVDSSGSFAIAQPDTLLYCQAARRICEGHAFSFSEGELLSTGTTSVVYPFVLALLYALGAVGKTLFRAGFLLNAIFYLVFLYGWGRVVCKVFERASTRLAAVVAVAGFGQTAFAALAQSDMGLWMAVSSLIAVSLVERRVWLCSGLLFLAPWVRPEGIMVAVALGAVLVLTRRFDRWWAAVAAGAAASVGVFALNSWLSGSAGFSSVAGKGYFSTYPLAAAVHHSFNDLLSICRTLFLSLPDAGFRSLYFLPVLSGALFFVGIVAADKRNHRFAVSVGFFALGLSILSVATSGWQGTNADRYFAWFLPMVLLFMIRGCEVVSGRLSGSWSASLPSVLFAGFIAFAAVAVAAEFRLACERQNSIVKFAERCERTMTLKSGVATLGECGAAYLFSPRRMHHLYGIYSPEYRVKDSAELIDLLKKIPKEKRFYYWLYKPSVDGALLGEELARKISETIVAGPFGYELRKFDWAVLDCARLARPESESVGALEGKRQVFALDVGAIAEERASAYELLTDYDLPVAKPFAVAETSGGKTIAETGRVVLGGEEFSVPLTVDSDAVVVVRTLSKATALMPSGYGYVSRSFTFSSPLELHLEIDGEEVGHVTFKLNDNGFTDAVFKIPGSAITHSPCRVALHGDHIACGYWFYQ